MEHHDKYINLDKAMEEIRNQNDKGLLFTPDDVYQLLRQIRFQDGFHLVHCEDCKYYSATDWIEARALGETCDCALDVIVLPNPDDYCSLGVFRNEEAMISE